MIQDYKKKTASALLLFGIIQWILVVILAEGIHPNYVSSIHYVSSLGSENTAFMYNISTIILGLSVASSSVLLKPETSRLFFTLFLIAGLATIGVGVFPENSRPMHGIVTPIALIFAALSAMASFKHHSKPASYFTFLLGLISLISGLGFIPYLGLPVESREMFFGLYKGTLERIVIYTNLIWILIFGGQLSK
jgi:hypothetical membrane protein